MKEGLKEEEVERDIDDEGEDGINFPYIFLNSDENLVRSPDRYDEVTR